MTLRCGPVTVVAQRGHSAAVGQLRADDSQHPHRRTTGEQNRGYVVIGNGGSFNDFSEVRYPAMGRTGAVGERRNCAMCHVNGSEQLPLQWGLSTVSIRKVR